MRIKKTMREIQYAAFRLTCANRRQARIDGINITLDLPMSNKMFYKLLNRYEKSEVAMAMERLRPTDRVLEVGAGIGFVCLYCMKHIGIKYYALVEANPVLRPVLERNFRLNGFDLDRVSFLSAAIGKESGAVDLHIGADFWESSLHARGRGSVRVPSMTSNEILSALPFEPNVLILDAEGGEQYVDFSEFRTFDTMIIELHPTLIGDQACLAIKDGISGAGFDMTTVRGNLHVFQRSSDA